MLTGYFGNGRNNSKILYKRQNKLTYHEISVFLTTVLMLFPFSRGGYSCDSQKTCNFKYLLN